MKILIDPGHASSTGGKRAKFDTFEFLEYQFNRDVAKQLHDILKSQGHTVAYTTFDDSKDMGLSTRASKGKGYDLLISIHANAASNSTASGYEVFVATNASKNSHGFADSWINEMKKQTSLKNRGKKINDFTVIYKAPCPSILIEVGFFTNETEAKWMLDNIELIAKICADSINNKK